MPYPKGKKFTEEHRQKLSKAGKGRPKTPEHKKHLSESLKRAWEDPETAKMWRESWKDIDYKKLQEKRLNDPKYRRSHKEAMESIEVRKKISMTRKKSYREGRWEPSLKGKLYKIPEEQIETIKNNIKKGMKEHDDMVLKVSHVFEGENLRFIPIAGNPLPDGVLINFEDKEVIAVEVERAGDLRLLEGPPEKYNKEIYDDVIWFSFERGIEPKRWI